ncbi:hypothetical protein EDB92DRAFT_684218 [Lactarius akahatsu]|uniref:DUF6535 domain-containing protein n=1 Tax=Lactarius akahatsu TaxID=416441 RepID=A0AAD4LH52_9AGAM|nr:hypothetical protein EDB92DRAFT_684218 [Lactarius akahatsu]
MYIAYALKLYEEDVENWKGGADDILVFTGLFSSTIATFIVINYQNLQQDPNVITQSLLAQIPRRSFNATTNGTSSTGTASPSTQSSFSPSIPVVSLNFVWFLSLVLSLTCALIATLFQRWTRRYRQKIQRNHTRHVHVHIFSRGGRKFRITWLVEMLPFLLLISMLLFFAGLVAFTFLINHIIAYITLTIVGICFLLYVAFDPMPFIFHDCPYYTPSRHSFRIPLK